MNNTNDGTWGAPPGYSRSEKSSTGVGSRRFDSPWDENTVENAAIRSARSRGFERDEVLSRQTARKGTRSSGSNLFIDESMLRDLQDRPGLDAAYAVFKVTGIGLVILIILGVAGELLI